MPSAVIACCKTKLPYAAPARELYVSPLFRKSYAYAKARGCTDESIFILSAMHHLVLSGRILDPYELSLGELNEQEKDDWNCIVGAQLERTLPTSGLVILLAGMNYAMPFEEPAWRGRLLQPLEGMSIGQRLQWLTLAVQSATAPVISRGTATVTLLGE